MGRQLFVHGRPVHNAPAGGCGERAPLPQRFHEDAARPSCGRQAFLRKHLLVAHAAEQRLGCHAHTQPHQQRGSNCRINSLLCPADNAERTAAHLHDETPRTAIPSATSRPRYRTHGIQTRPLPHQRLGTSLGEAVEVDRGTLAEPEARKVQQHRESSDAPHQEMDWTRPASLEAKTTIARPLTTKQLSLTI